MEQLKILIVDDENEIIALMKKYLEVEGYIVDTAEDGFTALDLFQRNYYHMIIADIMMPKMNGIELLKKIRQNSNVLFLLLTAKDAEIDRVLGFKLGADDYITKPFYMNELLARVEAHLRRYHIQKSDAEEKKLLFKGLEIDLKKIHVVKNEKKILLRAKEFELLAFLAQHQGQVFSKKQIFENVWENDYMHDDNTVTVHIRRLRKKIEDDPDNPELIKTVWGLGYKFEEKRSN